MLKTRSILMPILLSIVLATGAYFAASLMPATAAKSVSSSYPAPVVNAVPKSVDPAAASANPGRAYGTNMSTQEIRHILDFAYEHYRFGPREEQLQRILNGRYERRVRAPY